MIIHPAWLRHDFRDLCEWVFWCSLLANLLPNIRSVDQAFERYPRLRPIVHDFYVWLIDMIAFIALNWRICLPSMDFRFFGFARTAKHAVRNWQQDRLDRRQV